MMVASLAIAAGSAQSGGAWATVAPGIVWSPRKAIESSPRKIYQEEEKIFSLRFVTYLTRFLLNYDGPSKRFWDEAAREIPISYTSKQVKETRLRQYGEFAASVEVGLRRFNSRDGIKELLVDLSRKFTSTSARRQLAILFSFLSKDEQPTREITNLIAQADNGTVTQIQMTNKGSGYTKPPLVQISQPVVDGGRPALAKPIMKDLGSIGKIEISNPGYGYNNSTPPTVKIDPPVNDGTPAILEPIISSQGTIDDIRIVNAGSGYSISKPPTITIEGFLEGVSHVTAEAVPRLELYVGGITVVNGGDSYGVDQDVKVMIQTPEETGGMKNGIPATAIANLKYKPRGKRSGGLPPESISQQLTQLLPDNMVPVIDNATGAYSVEIPFDHVSSSWLLAKVSRCGGALDPVFGPRGCSPVEREKTLDVTAYGKFAISGALCAAISHAALTPLEVIKTKAQTDPTRVLGEIISSTFKQGIRELYRGTGPTAVGFFVGGSMGFGFTELFRRLIAESAGPAYSEQFSVPIVISASIGAVILSCIGVVPFEATRIKMQSGESSGGFIATLQEIGKESGLVGYYEGLNAILFKEIPFALCKFAVFDAVCQFIYDRYPAARESLFSALLVSVIGGAISGAISAVVSHPADTVLTSLYSEEGTGATSEEDLDKGDVVGAMREKIASGGLGSLFVGVGPRVFFAAALLGSEFLLYDYLKVLLQVSPDDLGQYLDALRNIK